MGQDFKTDKVIRHIYIHIPFCLKKCSYCSFYSIPYSKAKAEEYCEFLIKELENYSKSLRIEPETIYLGGGTPSLIAPEIIGDIINRFRATNLREVTIEINPVSVSLDYLKKLKKTKVNRISMGVQSFNDNMLSVLGRLHNNTDTHTVFNWLREAGFDNVSLDLIYGTPKQTVEDIEKDIYEMLKLNPEHISTYCLSLGDDVPLVTRRDELPEDNEINRMYYIISRILRKNGYKHYEISNFSKSGYESKHNLAYWKLNDYLGLGAAACGLVDKAHYCNPPDINEYYEKVQNDIKYPGREKMSRVLMQSEYIIMNLRTEEGMRITDFNSRFDCDFLDYYKDSLDKVRPFISFRNGRIRIKRSYWFVSNSILEEFVEV